MLETEPAWARVRDGAGVHRPRRPASKTEDPVFAALSAREREVLLQLAKGHSNADVGRALFISEKTGPNSRHEDLEKLGVQSRAEAIVLVKDKRLGGTGA